MLFKKIHYKYYTKNMEKKKQVKEIKAKKVEKGRDWTFIVYPESCPENWIDILNKTYLKVVISPLHDKDYNADGELKKPHYHVLISYEGPVTYNAVTKITEMLNATIPQKVASSKGLVRYMLHMDNPEKAQYSLEDIKALNGADIQSYFELTATNRLTIMKEIISFIYENRIDNYADFLMFCIANNDDWFNVAINSNTLAINKMLDGMYQKNSNR